MAKLSYRYGTMNSSKTANLLMVAHNYESEGRRILCLKSSLDTRWGENGENEKKGMIRSRAVPEGHVCEMVQPTENLFKFVRQYDKELKEKYSSGLAAVLVDEAQFLTKEQVRQLRDVVESNGIDVLCFGLKNTFVDGELFDGAEALVYYADSIEEIKTICKYCNAKATQNLRVINGKAVYDGDTYALGDVKGASDTYAQVCYKHYINPPAPIEGRNSKKKIDYNETLKHIIKYQNEKGYFKEYNKIDKSDLIFTPFIFGNTLEEIKRIKYIVIDNLCIDLDLYREESNRVSERKKIKNSPKDSIISGWVAFALIDFIYLLYNNDKNTAFSILRDSYSDSTFEVYDNLSDLEMSKVSRQASLKYYNYLGRLPDGKEYYMEPRSDSIAPLLNSLISGVGLRINKNNIGFLLK
jgi:thymidine kinase